MSLTPTATNTPASVTFPTVPSTIKGPCLTYLLMSPMNCQQVVPLQPQITPSHPQLYLSPPTPSPPPSPQTRTSMSLCSKALPEALSKPPRTVNSSIGSKSNASNNKSSTYSRKLTIPLLPQMLKHQRGIRKIGDKFRTSPSLQKRATFGPPSMLNNWLIDRWWDSGQQQIRQLPLDCKQIH